MSEGTLHASAQAPAAPMPPVRRRLGSDLSANGEPYVWIMGAALVGGLAMILGLMAYVITVGTLTFWPAAVATVTTTDGKVIAGEAFRTETYRVPEDVVAARPASVQKQIADNLGNAERTLYRVGNFDLFGEDFVWVPDFDTKSVTFDRDMYFIERLEWGPFVGRIMQIDLDGKRVDKVLVSALQASDAQA